MFCEDCFGDCLCRNCANDCIDCSDTSDECPMSDCDWIEAK